MRTLIASCIPRRGAVIGSCAAFCALIAAALAVSASPAHAQGVQDCVTIDDIQLLNAAEAGGLRMEPPLVVRNTSRGDGFTAHVMLSCHASDIIWGVYDVKTRLPILRLDTDDAGDHVRGDGVSLTDDRVWDPDGAGPLPPVQAAHYEIYFSNGEKNLWPDDKKSMQPDSRYLLQIAVVPTADPSDRIKYFDITVPESVGDGIFDRILNAVRPENLIRTTATGIANGTQSIGCSAVGEAGGVPPNNCDEDDAVSGGTGARPVVSAVNFLSMPRGSKSECYADGEYVEVEVRFNRELVPVEYSGAGTSADPYQLRNARWAHEHLFLQLEMNDAPDPYNPGSDTPYRYARYDGDVISSHQKGWVFYYEIQRQDYIPNHGIGIHGLVLRDDPDTGESPTLGSPPWDGIAHAKLDPERGISPGTAPIGWYISDSVHSSGIVFPSHSASASDRRHCVNGAIKDKVLIEELELTTFAGLLIGTPAHLTYEREITARGWRVAMNIVYAVLLPIIIGWMGMTLIVKPLVGGQDVEWHEMIPRLILGLVAAASSYWWIRLLIDLADALSQYVAHALSVSPGDLIVLSGKAMTIFLGAAAIGLVKVFVALYLIFILFGLLIISQFIIRIVMLNLLIILAPIGMSMWILPHTAGWGRKWLSMFMITLWQHALQLMAFALAISFVKAVIPGSGDISEATGGSVDSLFWSLLLGIAGMYLTFRLPSMLGAGDVYEGMLRYIYMATNTISNAPSALSGIAGGLGGAVGGGLGGGFSFLTQHGGQGGGLTGILGGLGRQIQSTTMGSPGPAAPGQAPGPVTGGLPIMQAFRAFRGGNP